MNYRYGYSLYTMHDLIEAYWFTYYSKEIDRNTVKIKNPGTIAYLESLSPEKQLEIITKANIKKINHICSYDIIPNLQFALHYAGYNPHIFIFNPDNITSTLNAAMQKRTKWWRKFFPLIEDTLGFSSIYFYIEPGNNTALEQTIKAKYKDYVFVHGKGIYIKLCPQDTFDLIYDFIDTVFSLI